MKTALPLPADLDQRIARAIRARGPVTKDTRPRNEFQAAQPWLCVVYALAIYVIFFVKGGA
jgi:hypothetical protein